MFSFDLRKKIQLYIVYLLEEKVKRLVHARLTLFIYFMVVNATSRLVIYCMGCLWYIYLCMSVTDWLTPASCYRLHPHGGGWGGGDRSRVRNQGQLGEREIQHWPDHGVRHHTSLIQTNVYILHVFITMQMKIWLFKSMCCRYIKGVWRKVNYGVKF